MCFTVIVNPLMVVRFNIMMKYVELTVYWSRNLYICCWSCDQFKRFHFWWLQIDCLNESRFVWSDIQRSV